MRRFLYLTAAALFCFAPGCDDDHDHVRDYDDDDRVYQRDVVVQQPVVQETQYVYDDRPVVVQQAPPPVIVERIPPPRPNYIWRPGYQRYDGRRFVWVKGTYVQSRPGYAYSNPHWRHGKKGYEFTPGHWRQDGNGRRGGPNNDRRGNQRDWDGNRDRDRDNNRNSR